ncbi:hypothetical protein ACQ4M4_27345 [Leptolyngbya sp. AN02str]|uniref:hypothetical protein n=1 Tax=Leptolyngbya sp. AN02str TaxID=3423363 RepID=UPI003D319520
MRAVKRGSPLVKGGIALLPEEVAEIEQIAQEKGVCKNAIFREAIGFYLREKSKKESRAA